MGEAARYLLTWNVIGLLVGKTGATVDGLGCSLTDDIGMGGSPGALAKLMGVGQNEYAVLSCADWLLHISGKVVGTGTDFADLWRRHLSGATARQLADQLTSDRVKS